MPRITARIANAARRRALAGTKRPLIVMTRATSGTRERLSTRDRKMLLEEFRTRLEENPELFRTLPKTANPLVRVFSARNKIARIRTFSARNKQMAVKEYETEGADAHDNPAAFEAFHKAYAECKRNGTISPEAYKLVKLRRIGSVEHRGNRYVLMELARERRPTRAFRNAMAQFEKDVTTVLLASDTAPTVQTHHAFPLGGVKLRGRKVQLIALPHDNF